MEYFPWEARNKVHKRHCVDYATTVALLSVWVFLTLASGVLLYFSHVATSADSEVGTTVSQDEIARTVAYSSAPIFLATIINEILVERCWRRVEYSILESQAERLRDESLAVNLRAANFGWVKAVKRLYTGKFSWKDFRAMISYGLLRWGTAVSIASIQFCVSWKPAGSDDDSGMYTANKRHLWIVGPAFLHACSIFATMAMWLMPPWTFFSPRFDDAGLLQRYAPYLSRVRAGSLADSEAVARVLESRKKDTEPLMRVNKPGMQFFDKLKGVYLSLVFMNAPPAIAWAYFRYMHHNEILRQGVYRFAFHFVFLAQNILYLLALDFVIWNLSLEGFCKSGKRGANRSLRNLGYTSGFMLFLRAYRQGRPFRAAIFLWLFWLQACLMRFLTVVYILCVTVLSYRSADDRDDMFDPQFWLAWSIMTAVFVFPLFVLWLLMSFQAPICEQNGWRWAKIAQNALVKDGFYGVWNGQAVWAEHVESFDSCKGQKIH